MKHKLLTGLALGIGSLTSIIAFAKDKPLELHLTYPMIVFEDCYIQTHCDSNVYANKIYNPLHIDPIAVVYAVFTDGYKNGKPIEALNLKDIQTAKEYYQSLAKNLKGEKNINESELSDANKIIDLAMGIDDFIVYNVDVTNKSLNWTTKVTVNGKFVPDYDEVSSREIGRAHV